MKYGCVLGLGCECECRYGIRRLKIIKKYFYLYFLYIFTIKIFLKNTLLCLDLQNKERRRQETHYYASEVGISAVSAKFKADFGLFRPFRSSVDITRYGRYGPIMAESARFSVNRAELVRIREKKKLRHGTDTRATASAASDLGAVSSQPRPCFLGQNLDTVPYVLFLRFFLKIQSCD